MERFIIVIFTLILCLIQCHGEAETVLSSVLTPDNSLIRQERSYYERYGYGRPYDRLDDRPSRCGRCDDDDDDDDDDYDRGRDRDDDRRSNRPTYGNRHDRNRNDDNDRRYDDDRNSNKNGTDDDGGNKKRPHDDDKDRDRHGSRRNKHRNRYDDRDRYRPDYYDRFLRDPYRDRYDDPYSRRPYDRYPYDRYDDYGRYDQSGYSGYRRPYYEDRYERGTAYDDSFGGYGPGVGRGSHDSFRPWDETYRGQAGWDAGGRGYYFASGRPDASYNYGQREYTRPVSYTGGVQNYGYSTGYRDPGYQASGYGSGYQDGNGYGYGQSSYGQSSGWRNIGAQRPYRDQRQRVCRRSYYQSNDDGVANLDKKRPQENRYPNRPVYDQKQDGYGQNQAGYGQIITYQPGSYAQSSTTQATSYLFQRNDDIVTQPETTVPPS